MFEPETINRDYVKSLLPKRKKETYKGTYGRVLVVAGSPKMAGAAVLTARAALRSGSGLVRISAEPSLWPIFQTSVAEATVTDRTLDKGNLSQFDAIVAGPGMGTEEDASLAICTILETYEKMLILDADALNLVSQNRVSLAHTKASLILTPHEGEAGRLLHISAEEVRRDRIAAAKTLAERFHAVVVLKGSRSLTAHFNGAVFANHTGNPGMATGGSGDVLAGSIASFAGQGMSAQEASCVGTYVHGFAGDLASEEKGEYGLIASDIAEALPRAILAIQKG
ncbi:MAG: NAD(P)H-hydrate dehydratase [Clostridiales Family XIII bacterium]|jgi:NAD(P)H-hydrate epimerase|nr:NAD(P)H-hydrate dehydratase [Clostridiales Family XIII bacterium]